jgi:RNA polymerase sigma-70 factor (ECF subfamily)
MIGDRVHAEDIVQEAAIIGLSKLESYQPGSNFVAWMAAIVRHCALNYARKVRNRATVSMDPAMLDQSERSAETDRPAAPIVSDTGVLHEAQAAFDDRLLRGLMALSDEARCCLLLRVVQQLSYAEISELMQIAQGTAMSHVHRGKNLLRRHMQEDDPPAAKGNPKP